MYQAETFALRLNGKHLPEAREIVSEKYAFGRVVLMFLGCTETTHVSAKQFSTRVHPPCNDTPVREHSSSNAPWQARTSCNFNNNRDFGPRGLIAIREPVLWYLKTFQTQKYPQGVSSIRTIYFFSPLNRIKRKGSWESEKIPAKSILHKTRFE